MAEKTVATPNGQQGVQTTEGTRTREWYITPAVDIYEMPEELIVLADLPGVQDLGRSPFQWLYKAQCPRRALTLRGRETEVHEG